MKPGPLWRISVVTNPEAEEAVTALLERLYGLPAAAFHDWESQTCRATLYSSQPQLAAKRDALEAGLNFIKDCGLDIGPAEISIRKIPREDWAESWKRCFTPIEIGPDLLIRPSWIKQPRKKRQAIVTLDPGLSFGTGHHPTTSYCLEELVACRNAKPPRTLQSFLDIGTGSGILAIAAVKLGFSPVKAFDFDPDSVRIAKANARKNRVPQSLSITRKNLSRLPWTTKNRCDLVCANLTSDLLIQEAPRILNRLKPNGRLILAGILVSQFPAVQNRYEQENWRLANTKIDGEWQSGAFISKLNSPAPAPSA